ncbi:BTB/POZ domain-containing protein 6-B-like [Mya arenaria]|uniref:BTB/POZ domain-containing protein 6-B-like n=1 Tax=Mya arenaria TaxID=6604 RepID=UPI0022E3A65A|nr:BTB/POZ domain-containing protein 6-B-like [Mya arenaria]
MASESNIREDAYVEKGAEDVKTSNTDDNTGERKHWQEDKGVPGSILYTYENSLWTDVTLECSAENGDTRYLKAHRMILASRSPVFEGMLFGPAADKGDTIQITSFTYELMDFLLRYLYSGVTALAEDTAIKNYKTAHFFQVPALVDECSQYLRSIFSKDNVCEILDLSLQYDNEGLRNAASDYIDQNASNAIETKGFLQVSQRCLEYMFAGDTFYVDEQTIFRRSLDWAKQHEKEKNPNKTKYQGEEDKADTTVKDFRKALGNALQYIRFGTMSFLEFSEIAGSSLNAEDIKSIHQYANNDTADEFRQQRLPKQEIVTIGKSNMKQIFDDPLGPSYYRIYVRNDIFCEGIDFSEMSVAVHQPSYDINVKNTVSPDFEIFFKVNIKISRVNYSFTTTKRNLSSNSVTFESPICLKASKKPYTLAVSSEFQLQPLELTVTTAEAEEGSAKIKRAKVTWEDQCSIVSKIRFLNRSYREFEINESENGDSDTSKEDDTQSTSSEDDI